MHVQEYRQLCLKSEITLITKDNQVLFGSHCLGEIKADHGLYEQSAHSVALYADRG